jgi:NADH-quinone oxidoreductase subunit E
MENIKRDIDVYKKKIKDNGFRLTRTREAVLDIMLKSSDDLDAEELFFLSHKKLPGIGQATIYRTLKLLEKENLVERTGYKDNKAKYRIKNSQDLNLRDPALRAKKSYPGKNKEKADTGHPLKTNYENIYDSYGDMEKINAIQDRLSGLLDDLNKIKNRKELALEDVMKDFGKVDKIVGYYQNQKSCLIQILLDIQNEYNWLPKHIILYISNKLGIPISNIYDITTFYKYFNLEPRGKHSIIVCTGTACHIRGAVDLLQRITNVLEIKPGDTTSDYNFTLDTVNCLGCCALGPVMMIDKKYFSNPSTGELKKILKQFN